MNKLHTILLLAITAFAGTTARANDTSIIKTDNGYLAVKNEVVAEKISQYKKNAAGTAAFSSRNNKVVKIYPDMVKREMHVVAKENGGTQIDFFVFDLQGTLVQQYKMNEKEHKRIAGLAPGTYVYRVFSGDTESAAGKFEIR
jgi:hypothetical protein